MMSNEAFQISVTADFIPTVLVNVRNLNITNDI